MTLLALEAVGKSYGADAKRTAVLKDINLRIRAGEFVAIVGFSGSGKTTLLRLVTKILALTAGHINLAGRRVDHELPHRRRIADQRGKR
jgi:nitrate/nitrite transport system ATP-binding protein